jgi:leukotriene-A4 hydrolase
MSRIDPHSYTDISQGRVSKVGWYLIVDFEKQYLRGEAVLELTGLEQDFIDLDTRDLRIKAVYALDKPLKWSLEEPNLIVGSRLRIELPAGKQELVIHIIYETSPNASALQWLKPEHTFGGKYPYLYSQCQAHHARSIIPIQDSPGVRFPFYVYITVPTPLVAVMSSAPGTKIYESADLATYYFNMPQPAPAYLLALAVGNIASKDLGPRSRVYAEPEILEKAAWEFERIESILQKGEGLFGPYLWDRYDFVVMPQAFPYGGMENARLSFLTPTLIAGDRSSEHVLIHESSHSWTGNLVTNATWEDFWLNEGITTWAQRRILEVFINKDSALLDAAVGYNSLQDELERLGTDSLFTKLKTNLKGVDPDEAYSRIPYEKGSLFLTLLEETAGREKFDIFIREYIERFQFTSITTEQFLEFLDEKLPGISEKVNAREWIYRPGIPSNAPVPHSEQLDHLRSLAANWKNGARPESTETRAWSAAEWKVYLSSLPKDLSYEGCEWLDANYHFMESGNSDILCEWLIRAIESGYIPAYPKVRDFLDSVGRMMYLKPLYRALAKREETRKMALEIFSESGSRYHPIARNVVERILANVKNDHQ